MEWYVKLHRKIQCSPIWQKPPEWRLVWIHILMNVQYQDNGIYKAWEGYFTYWEIASNLRVKCKSVENCLRWLKQEAQVEVEKTTRGNKIRVLNWGKYQSKEEASRKQVGSTEGAGSGAIKEERRKKKEKTDTHSFDEFWNLYQKKKDTAKCKKKWNLLTQEKRQLALWAVKNYVESTPDVQYRKNPLTWLNGECWLDETISTTVVDPSIDFSVSNQSMSTGDAELLVRERKELLPQLKQQNPWRYKRVMKSLELHNF